jgi:hypothetical protein
VAILGISFGQKIQKKFLILELETKLNTAASEKNDLTIRPKLLDLKNPKTQNLQTCYQHFKIFDRM